MLKPGMVMNRTRYRDREPARVQIGFTDRSHRRSRFLPDGERRFLPSHGVAVGVAWFFAIKFALETDGALLIRAPETARSECGDHVLLTASGMAVDEHLAIL
jgi:hypothetical protein